MNDIPTPRASARPRRLPVQLASALRTADAPQRGGLRPRLLMLLLASALAMFACGGDTDGDDSAGSGSGSIDPAIESNVDTGDAEPGVPAESEQPVASGDGESEGGESGDGDGDGGQSGESESGGARIVSLSPTGTEMLFAIGAGSQVVAVDKYSYFPEEAPVTDLDGWAPNLEAIISYDPDLVVIHTNEELRASLETLGVEVFATEAPPAFDGVYSQIEQLGAVVGRAEEAAQLVEGMRAEIAELVAAASASDEHAGLTYYHEIDDSLYSVTSGTFIGQVYDLFGLVNVADPADADSGSGYPQLSYEYLLDADPDVIFVAHSQCCEQNAEIITGRPGWEYLTAVQEGRIIGLDADIVSRWGPRLVDFIKTVSETLAEIGESG